MFSFFFLNYHFTFFFFEFQVFFRNNHFNTLFKYESHLYLLLTDIGYEHQGGYVWERLTEIDGDTMCCGSDFKRSPTATSMEGSAATSSSHDPNDPDYLLALEMQRQYGGGSGGGGGGGEVVVGEVVSTSSGASKSGEMVSTVGTARVIRNDERERIHESGLRGVTEQQKREQEEELRRLKEEHHIRLREEVERERKSGEKKKKKKSSCIIS